MKLWKNLKKAFQNYLDRMAKSNQQLFGNSTPDCCKLNRENNNRHHS